MTQYDEWKKQGIELGGDADIVIPMGRLSYTSINMLKSNESEWIEQYIHGNKRSLDHLPQIKVGAEIAEKRELDKDYGDKYPSLPVKEKMMIVPIKLTGLDKRACLLIKVDSMNEDMSVLLDDKTEMAGKRSPWTRKNVYDSLQFRLYCLAIYEHTGKIPRFWANIIHLDFDNKETGDFTTFGVTYPYHVMEATREVFTNAVRKANNLVETFKGELI